MGLTRDRREPLHILHPGKTGGTALKQALLDHGDASRYRLLPHGHDVTLSHVPVGEKLIFTVREPLSRFVSAFNGRLREGRPRYHYPWRQEEQLAFASFKTPDQLASALTSDDEAERRQAECAMRGIGHLNTLYSYWFGDQEAFLSRLPDLYFIGFQEQLDADFELLKRKLGLPQEASLSGDATVAHRTPASFDQRLSDVARSNLERWYEYDIAFVQLCRELAPLVDGKP
jgi:hypothetical protein